MGRLAALLLAIALAQGGEIPKYDRSEWMPSGWEDADGDCQDTRQEVLIRDAITYTLSEDGCRVVSGQWFDWYSGDYINDPSLIDIDHLVPLQEAHNSGGWRWSQTKKRQYANDLSDSCHLVATHRSLNRSKGAKDIAEWRIRRTGHRCAYAHCFAHIKLKWNMDRDPMEQLATQIELEHCDL